MKRIMGIDFGDARTGIAISDLLCSIVGSTTVIHSRNREKTLAEIVRLTREHDVGEIVMGLPKNMNGSEGERALKCKAFAEKLQETTGIETVMQDERLTTVSAHRALNVTNVTGKKRKDIVDAVSAVMILEDYLASKK